MKNTVKASIITIDTGHRHTTPSSQNHCIEPSYALLKCNKTTHLLSSSLSLFSVEKVTKAYPI